MKVFSHSRNICLRRQKWIIFKLSFAWDLFFKGIFISVLMCALVAFEIICCFRIWNCFYALWSYSSENGSNCKQRAKQIFNTNIIQFCKTLKSLCLSGIIMNWFHEMRSAIIWCLLTDLIIPEEATAIGICYHWVSNLNCGHRRAR